ncbi:MAG: hypothetical protein KDB02_04650 [Acidimicrobiales bacterium]|nr:hypothetical protein [Acidimicrobiales bacterium]
MGEQLDGNLISVETGLPLPHVRPPRSDGATWERILLTSSETAVADSMHRLEARMPIHALLAAEWATVPTSVEIDDWFGGVEHWELIDTLLGVGHVPSRRILVCDGSDLVAPEAIPADPLAFDVERPNLPWLMNHATSGGGFLLSEVDLVDQGVGRNHEDLDRVTLARTRCDLGVVGEGAVLHQPHDNAARIVMAIDRPVLVQTHAAPGDGHSAPLPTSHRVEPGTGLLVPMGRGWRVSGDGAGALVSMIVVPRWRVVDLVEEIEFESLFWPMLRADVPSDLDEPILSYSGSVLVDGFDRAAESICGELALANITARRRARMQARWSTRLSVAAGLFGVSLAVDPEVRCPLPGGLQVASVSTDTEPVLYGAGRRYRVDAAAAAAVALLSDGRVHTRSEVLGFAPDGLDPSIWSSGLIQEAMGCGIVEVVRT